MPSARFFRHELSEFPAFQSLAEKAVRALRREFTAVDIRLKSDQPMVLEVNRQPDFKGFECASHFDVASVVVKYIRQWMDTLLEAVSLKVVANKLLLNVSKFLALNEIWTAPF